MSARFLLFGRRPASPGQPSPSPGWAPRPDWVQADPARIERALAHARAKPSGGWAVLDASDRIAAPRRFVVAGRSLVAWRAPDGVRVAPEACPHMGASLCDGHVDEAGRLVCPWHGLALDRRHGRWATLPVHDDGVLTWVRLPELLALGEAPTDAPVIGARPERFIAGVVRLIAQCDPSDVIANRLDPWHGVHFHPHSFLRLRVISEAVDHVTVRVVYKVLGPLAIEVDARFACPDPRTIVMTIVDGDGLGSVVETHASPIGEGQTAVIEATLATSDRFRLPLFRGLARVVRAQLEARSARLWVEDRAYAERRFALRRDQVPRPASRLVPLGRARAQDDR